MSDNISYAYTPAKVATEEAMIFQIPLYQRLFEWDDEQVNQLLYDLLSAYTRNPDKPYYIGMLTSKVSNETELVDGQQRFTVMVLLGIYFGWKEFLLPKDELGNRQVRLQFYAREDDKKYLLQRIKGSIPEGEYINPKMENGIKCISSFVEKHHIDKEKFGKFIYNNLTFFLSKLPREYTAQDLNTYFERMNTVGKSLENYEILKVEFLRRLDGNQKEQYTRLWNAVSQMDKMLLRPHTYTGNKKESLDSLRDRYQSAILNAQKGDIFNNTFQESTIKDDDYDEERMQENAPTIAEIKESEENPYKIIKRRSDEHAMLTFPEFLLQVLYITLNSSTGGLQTTDFFDVHQLSGTFEYAFRQGLDVKMFMVNLIIYRLLTDYYLIRLDDDDEDPYPFDLYKGSDDEESGKEAKRCVRQYQSMLYSASSPVTYYFWMPNVLTFLDENIKQTKSLKLDASTFLRKLKEIDNNWHPQTELDNRDNFTYRTVDRYWFWRFDYYIWEKRKFYFSDAQHLKVAEDYVFRRNRSLEHIAPQHPVGNSSFQWNDEQNPNDETIRDSMGNLVMISSGQNSSLSNEPFEMKRAHMASYSKGELNGRTESLKMLYVYSQYGSWNRDNITEHGNFTFDILKLSYK